MPPTVRPPVFHILLALSEQRLHGLGIAARVEHATDGAVELGPGTLYRSLKEMASEGLVRDADPPEDDSDPRRRYYEITPAGQTLLAEEVAHLERLVRIARDRKVLPEGA